MPNILFASNSVSHFPGCVIGAAGWSFDSNRVPYSLEFTPQFSGGSPNIPVSPLANNEWWFHFRHGSSDWDVNQNEPIIQICNAEGDNFLRLFYHDRPTTEGFHFYLDVDGGSYFDTRRYVPVGNNQLRTYDIRYFFNGINVIVEFYCNEILLHAWSIPAATFEVPLYVIFGGQIVGNHYVSEIIIADGDTRNARLDLLRPTAVGAYGNWNGPVVSLSDDDPTTGMTTVLPDQNQSTVLTPYTGANNISNIVQMTTTVRGINSPENLRHLIRLSGVDYLSPDTYAVPFSKDYQITDWAINPATSLPWTAADLQNSEFGFRSLA